MFTRGLGLGASTSKLRTRSLGFEASDSKLQPLTADAALAGAPGDG